MKLLKFENDEGFINIFRETAFVSMWRKNHVCGILVKKDDGAVVQHKITVSTFIRIHDQLEASE